MTTIHLSLRYVHRTSTNNNYNSSSSSNKVLRDIIWQAVNAAGIPAATGMGLVADQAATKKSVKYADFTAAYIFQPIALENLDPISSSTPNVLSNLGQKISNFSATTGRLSFYSSVSP